MKTVTTDLRTYLCCTYSVAGQPPSNLIRIDDRNGDDVYPAFCDMHVTVPAGATETFILTIDNIPYDGDVEGVAAELRGIWRETRLGRSLTLSLTVDSEPAIKELATAVRGVTGRGKEYADRNWKWIARRTANSLERLARTLVLFRSEVVR